MPRAPIERLPSELLHIIIFFMSFQNVLRLLDASNILLQRLQSEVFSSRSLRDNAMRVGCKKGLTRVVRAALAHRASPSFVRYPRFDGPGWTKMLTLQLAVEGQHVDLFRELIAQGARVDAGTSRLQPTVGALIDPMCRPLNAALLKPFLDAGLAGQLERTTLDDMLLTVVRSSEVAAVGFASQLLDAGANARSYGVRPSYQSLFWSPIHSYGLSHFPKNSVAESPVSAALVSGQVEMVQLVIERGGSIDGVIDLYSHCSANLPLHVPLFAAVRAMAAHRGDRTCLQMCLALGADINTRVRFTKDRNEKNYNLADALLLYLDAVTDWKARGQVALDNLQFIFDSGFEINGSVPTGKPYPPLARYRENPDKSTAFEVLLDGQVALDNLEFIFDSGFEINGSVPTGKPYPPLARYRENPDKPTAFEVLLDGQGFGSLEHPAFVSALQLVVRKGALVRRTGRILKKYHANPQHSPAIARGWGAVLSTLVDPTTPREDLSTVLRTMLLCNRPVLAGDVPPHERAPEVGPLTQDTVKMLVAAGADLNAVPDSHAPTVLQSLCHWYVTTVTEKNKVDSARGVLSKLRASEALTAAQAAHLKFLVSCGADPGLEWEGERPEEVLLGALETRGRRKGESEVVEDMVRCFREAMPEGSLPRASKKREADGVRTWHSEFYMRE